MFYYTLFDTPKILTKKYIQSVGRALEEVTKIPQKGSINIIAVSLEEITRLNTQYRGKKGATDILTFPYLESVQTEKDIAGEIYLCLEKIKLYASERGTTYKEQLQYIIIHGMVHMMGYDHEREKDAQKMEEVEQKIHTILMEKGL
ncbi:MAG: rRNA maturation RNase YbeY [Candidatus Gracilibacteria bacterium]